MPHRGTPHDLDIDTQAKAVQYISRSKFFGLPFHAAYPIAAAIDGTITKKVNTRNAASTHSPLEDLGDLVSLYASVRCIRLRSTDPVLRVAADA